MAISYTQQATTRSDQSLIPSAVSICQSKNSYTMSKKFATLDSVRKETEKGDGNEYYSGGNDARGGGSGLAVEGQPEHVKRILEQARGDAGDRPHGVPSSKVTLYKNGFVVDDGEFRDISVDENRQFIETLMEGHVPRELVHCVVDGKAHIDLENKGDVDYVAPHRPYIAFGGSGSTLGGLSQSTQGVVLTPEMMEASPAAMLNESAPSTTLQIRLHDGKKLRLKMNLSNTVSNILGGIRQSGGTPPGPFSMSHGYPPQQIASLTSTIEELGLSGAAITVKLV